MKCLPRRVRSIRRINRLVILTLATGSLLLPHGTQAQIEYVTDGNPTALEEEIRWHVNRGRFDRDSENTLRGTSYSDIPATAGPLAPNQSLALACRHHSEDMARNNAFQHDTVPGSSYYDPVTQPTPWDRFRAEGYFYNGAGENIAAGYGGAESAYVAWWKSTGHRKNMYNSSMCEIGNGHYYWSNSSYRHYYTMDLGRISGKVFFTGTLFHDDNHDNAYGAGEGVPDIAVRLKTGTADHTHFDISTEVGSFAIPCASIPSGTVVTVLLSNTTPSQVILSIPNDHGAFQELRLEPHQTVSYGTFEKPDGSVNSGWRNVTPTIREPGATPLQLTVSDTTVALTWPSESGWQYQLQASCDCQTWTNLTSTPLDGTGGMMDYLDTAPTPSHKLYRLIISSP
jgi:hypothetical protein